MKTVIILIDDDEITLMLEEFLFDEYLPEYEVKKFLSPLQASSFIKQNNTGEVRFVLMLDINMPEQDCWEFMEESLDPRLTKETCLIFLLTSSTDRLDKEKAEQYDLVRAYFEKPLNEKNIDYLKEIL